MGELEVGVVEGGEGDVGGGGVWREWAMGLGEGGGKGRGGGGRRVGWVVGGRLAGWVWWQRVVLVVLGVAASFRMCLWGDWCSV